MSEEQQSENTPATPENLAKDVARLYSFAHADEGSYRIFPRRARPATAQRPVAELDESAPDAPAQTAPAAAQKEQVPIRPEPGISEPAKPEPAPVAQAAAAPVSPPAPPPASRTQATPTAATASAPIQVAEPRPAAPPAAALPKADGGRSAIGVSSFAGGVGKTTIVANIGRLLSGHGEHVLLVDVSASGLLPFYFGADHVREGLRTFVSPDALSLPLRTLGTRNISEKWLEEEVKPAMASATRTIFDLGQAAYNLLPEILPLCAVMLIPLVVDLNSILSIPRLEEHNQTMREKHGLNLPQPIYLLSKYDDTSERERKGRELIAQQVGDRLLPFSIRRSPYAADAIAQRMTVVDFAGDSDVAADYRQLADWLKKAVPVAQPARAAARWSEA